MTHSFVYAISKLIDRPSYRKFRLYGDTANSFDTSPDTGSFQRHVDGLTALLLSLKKKPIIRYERMSNMAKKLGNEVQVSAFAYRRAMHVLS
jgi:hypothetical protein